MKYKLLMLDHDDTAIDSARKIHYPAFVEILKIMRPERTVTLDEFMLKSFTPGFTSFLRENYNFSDEELEQEYRLWKEIVTSIEPEFFPGFLDIVRRFQNEGGIIAVASTGTKKIIRKHYADQGITIDDIYGYSPDENKCKPHPYPCLDVMRKYDLNPSDILVVDDLQFGLQMAESAGCDFACSGWGHNNISEIAEYMKKHSRFFFSSVREFSDFLFSE